MAVNGAWVGSGKPRKVTPHFGKSLLSCSVNAEPSTGEVERHSLECWATPTQSTTPTLFAVLLSVLSVGGIFGQIKLFNAHLRRFSRFCCIINLTCKSIDEIFLGILNTPIISVKIKFFIQGKAICCFIKVYF